MGSGLVVGGVGRLIGVLIVMFDVVVGVEVFGICVIVRFVIRLVVLINVMMFVCR